ncbi:hypothetical protein L9F63_001278 [Diploptera punctata]|uniref:Uncharacterized protein n=1 Tax=Diploptera punctata TaxID=6984 RepID=A0AAD8A477_DIPPU|nr:hypothetical protein L9F63_001278 [Diploptera punctata]
MENFETRKKKDATGTNIATTDPKVARELNQIFSSPVAGDHSHEVHSKDSSHIKQSTDKQTTETVHVATTHSPAITASTTALSKTKLNETEKINKENTTIPHKVGSEEETVEQPVTMSRSEAPLDIKKKSINWSDYFGIDRRRKKTGPPGSNPIDDEWLLNQYYKNFAMATNPGKKRSIMYPHDSSKSRSTALQQPFDTRVFDTDVFARTAQHEANAVKKNSQPSNLGMNII